MFFLKVCMIFAAGVVVDMLVTRYTRAVAERKPALAATMSGVLALVNLCALGLVLSWATNGIMPILAYAGGNWVGTYFMVKR